MVAATLVAQGDAVPNADSLQKMAARFVPTDIMADVSNLSASDRRVLAKLIEASKIIDAIFLRQVWAGNEAMLLDLARDQTPEGRARLHYFLINKGPWSRLDRNEAFVAGAPLKPDGADFYPDALPKGDLERWIASLPDAERARATGFFTVVRREGGRSSASEASRPPYTLVPYNIEYQNELARAAALLREAAELSTEPTLKSFLTKRADAFLSNDYYDSDVAWMELKGAIEPTIGPYEVYEDELFNALQGGVRVLYYRAGRGEREAQKFGAELQDIENHLPIDPKYRNPKLGGLAPLVVVNEIFAAGDANPRRADGGVQPA